MQYVMKEGHPYMTLLPQCVTKGKKGKGGHKVTGIFLCDIECSVEKGPDKDLRYDKESTCGYHDTREGSSHTGKNVTESGDLFHVIFILPE